MRRWAILALGGLLGWSLEARAALVSLDRSLTASDGASGAAFGIALALSNGTLLVGAPGRQVGDNADQGAVYVFTGGGSSFVPQATLYDPGGAAQDGFGGTVALSGDTAIIGGVECAYAFVQKGGAWSLQQVLRHGGSGESDYGRSVAVSGDIAIVGASSEDVGTGVNQGAAHVYVRTGNAWSGQQILSAVGGTSGNLFGVSVALSGDTALVGSYGPAYVFVRSGSEWSLQQELVGPRGMFGGAKAVAVYGDTAVVGSLDTTVSYMTDQGAAFVFVRKGGIWSLVQTVIAEDGLDDDLFGASVALTDGGLLVGALGHDPRKHAGTAYLYTPGAQGWTLKTEFVGANALSGDDFYGSAIALSADTLAVGAQSEMVGSNAMQGAVYVAPVTGCVAGACTVLSDGGSFPDDN